MKKNVVQFLLLTLILISARSIKAQPYLDIANVKYTNSPNAGLINQNNISVNIQYWNVVTNIPLQFKNKKDAVIFSPFFEKWCLQISNTKRQNYSSIALPVSVIKSIPDSKWGFLLSGIGRMNDISISRKTMMQVGGAFLLTRKANEGLTWKLGVYANNELFGIFVILLAGIDWRINLRNNLFGILPGSLTYEHKINDHFYYGANFRAITNSYRKNNGYWRIDENQLGIYLDAYFTKNIVFSIEAGHSLFRKIRTGEKHVSKTDEKVNDNLYFKASLSYRVRFLNK